MLQYFRISSIPTKIIKLLNICQGVLTIIWMYLKRVSQLFTEWIDNFVLNRLWLGLFLGFLSRGVFLLHGHCPLFSLLIYLLIHLLSYLLPYMVNQTHNDFCFAPQLNQVWFEKMLCFLVCSAQLDAVAISLPGHTRSLPNNEIPLT